MRALWGWWAVALAVGCGGSPFMTSDAGASGAASSGSASGSSGATGSSSGGAPEKAGSGSSVGATSGGPESSMPLEASTPVDASSPPVEAGAPIDAGPTCIRVLDCTDCVGGSCMGTTALLYCCTAAPTIDAAVVAPDPNCPAGVYTTVSGVVYDPSIRSPLPNVTVFAPKSMTLPASCDAPSFYGSAVTDAAGHFVVSDVPPGKNIPLVVQSGGRRKEFTLPSVTKCIDNPQPDMTLYLPDDASSVCILADAGTP